MSGRAEETELARATRARIPAGALGALAGVRARPGFRVSFVDRAHAPRPEESAELVLVEWERGDKLALERVLPIEGALLYRHEASGWFAVGSRIPASPQPELREPRALAHALTPAPFVAEPEPSTPGVRARLVLVRDARPRPTTAVRCTLDELVRWAETATAHALARVKAARAGDRVLLVGPKLPPVGERYWGHRVLRPLGFATDPDLPEAVLAGALGLGPLELAIVTSAASEAVPGETLAPLSRAAVRAAAGPPTAPATSAASPSATPPASRS